MVPEFEKLYLHIQSLIYLKNPVFTEIRFKAQGALLLPF